MYFFRKKVCKEGHMMDPSWKKCPICLSPVIGWLVLLDEKKNSRNIILTIHEGKNKVGTGVDCEVRTLFNSISRHHAMISFEHGHYTITDLGSLGGTFVNNRQISNHHIIDGDIIKLANVEFKFKCI
ncbi:MAG: FHA domain-containing protein [Spirochaetes bacterium]|nr:FHA domain-containing protein [Spirochaetota bacterium]